MTDVEWIFVVLGLLYALESVRWIRPGTATFPSVLGQNRSPESTVRLLGNENGTLVLTGLMPGDAMFLAPALPVSIGTEGVSNFVRAAPVRRDRAAIESRFATWEELSRLRQDQNRLLLDRRLFATCHSSRSAAAIHKSLKTEVSQHQPNRANEAESELIAEYFGTDSARDRIQQWNDATKLLSVAALLLFLIIFPVGIARYLGIWIGPINGESLLWYLGAILLIWWWNVVLVYLAHRRLYPDRTWARAGLVLKSLVSPVVPMRNADALASDLFTHLHPLALATALFQKDDQIQQARENFSTDGASDEGEPNSSESRDSVTHPIIEEISGHVIRDLLFPLLPVDPPDCSKEHAKTIDQHHHRTLEQFESIADLLDFDCERLLAAPELLDDLTQSYCPRCQQEYTIRTANCAACGDRETVPLAS